MAGLESMSNELNSAEEAVLAEQCGAKNAAMPTRALNWARRVWRSAASAVVVGLALLLGWHVVNGKHGLSMWEQKRVEDKQLQKDISDLQQENARLRVRVDKLKSDPDAIEREAREKLRYAKQGEVIVDLSGETRPASK